MHFYKRDPDAALAGMVGLTLDERGAYNTVIDLLYARDGDLPDDEHLICSHLGCRPQTWRRIKTSLISKGKLHLNSDQTGTKLTANRVQTTINEALQFSDKQRFRAEKRWKNNHQDDAGGNASIATPTATPTVRKKEEDAPSGASATEIESHPAIVFEAGAIRVNARDLKKWQDAFSHLDVKAELLALQEWAGKQANWFMAVQGALAKRNREALVSIERANTLPPLPKGMIDARTSGIC